MIFFGWRHYTWTWGEQPAQPLTCPNCGRMGTFTRKNTMRFIHVFWIPLIPISKLTHLAQCPNCKAKYDASVLDRL